MQRLTDQQHWDEFHTRRLARPLTVAGGQPSRPRLRSLLGERLFGLTYTYSWFQLFEVILPRYLAPQGGGRVFELGSAPGYFLLQYKEKLGLEPFGIEYSEEGIKSNRRVFESHGVDPDNVIPGDFYAEEVRRRFRESFDVVTSYSLIEHFADPCSLCDIHQEFLKPGGLLVVLVPNLRGINHALYKFFNKKDLVSHNFAIMDRDRFGACFSPDRLEPLFLGYLGTFTFQIFNTEIGSYQWPLLKACHKGQNLLNILYRLLLRQRGLETGWLSPWLVYVGRKK